MPAKEYFDPTLLNKYNTQGPRYTSYPTALEFHDGFSQQDWLHALQSSPNRDLSLYVHIPFCHSLCYYCGCNKVVTRHSHKADEYLDALQREMQNRSRFFGAYKVRQLHLGGGTPSFLSQKQMQRLMDSLRDYFDFAADAEISIEVDPRRVPEDYPTQLAAHGFNRISIGVQDTNSAVQEAINRLQDTAFIARLVGSARQAGMRSVNLDLVYGLPHQTPERFAQTLQDVLAMDPDRISLFSYAHMPQRFAAQRKIKDEWLPDINAKFALMRQAIETLCDAGYQFIGMDHFAKPNDELAIAQREGRLNRNFQGYTTTFNCDLLGLGVSAISQIGHSLSQNHKDMADYYEAIDCIGHALHKGIALSADDMLRARVISQLMCNFSLDVREIERQFAIVFADYFADELTQLHDFAADGLLSLSEDRIEIFPRGRLLVRNVCMHFDAYLQRHAKLQRFSRVI